MSIVCVCKLILFTQLYFCHSWYRRGHGRARPAVTAVNGLSSTLSANQIASIQSQELYLVLWVFIYVACKLQLEAVTYDEINTVDFRASLQGIPLLRLFLLILLYKLRFRSLLTRANAWNRRWIRINQLMLSTHFENEWVALYSVVLPNFLLCGIILKFYVLGILRVVVSVEIFCFESLLVLSLKYSEKVACRGGAKE